MSTTYEFVVIAPSEDGGCEELGTFSDVEEATLFQDRVMQERGALPGVVVLYGRKVKGGGR